MKTTIPMDIGGMKAQVEMDTATDSFAMSLTMEDKRELRLEIDNLKQVMKRVQDLTGRAAWELKAVMDELIRRLMDDAKARNILLVAVTAQGVEELLRRIFPEAITQPAAGAKK